MASCFVCRTSARSFLSREEGITYHRFPTSRSVICSKWKEFAGLADNDNVSTKRLCSRHFKPNEFIVKPFRKNLRCGAVPSLCRPRKRTDPKDSESVPTSSAPFPLEVLFAFEDPPKNHHLTSDPPLSETSESNDALDSHIGSATIDHDYVITTNLPESQLQACPEKNQEDLSSQLLLDDVRKDLCRLCGQKGFLLVPIFVMPSLNVDDVSISSKIEMYLPFKVKMEDPLPSQVCLNCCDILNHWHELYVTCVAANAVLWKTFGKESDEESSDDLTDAVTSIQEEVQQNKANENSKVEVEITQELSEPLIPEESLEKTDIICAECGKSKTEIEITEDKADTEEFDKNFLLCNFSYKCKYCYELFKNPNDRKNHMAMCRQLSTICELCGLKVSCRKNLRRHIYGKHVKKVNLRRYLCDACDKCFKTTSGLSYHIKNRHEVRDTSPKFYCELCCTAFVFESNFLSHQKKHAEGKIKPVFQIEAFHQGENSQDSENTPVYTCPVCQEVCSDMLSLVVHLTTKKKIKCSVCHKVTSCEKRFLVHECGQWACQYCSKTFSNKEKWIVHERLHTGEKPIKCRKCDQTFRSWHARKAHENRHNPAYECSYCGRKFRNKYVFRDHVSCHEGKIFLCSICNKKFSGRKNLWKHTNIFHKTVQEPNC